MRNRKNIPKEELLANTFGCKGCRKPISYAITKKEYCLECMIKGKHKEATMKNVAIIKDKRNKK